MSVLDQDQDKQSHHLEPTVTSLSPSPVPSSHTEMPSTFSHDDGTSKSVRLIDSARLALTILVILFGITVLSTSADVVSEYNKTHLPGEFLLPLWGEQDIRGEVAILVGGTIVIVATGVGLIGEKLYAFRNLIGLHKILAFLAPTIGLITSIVATALQYHINQTSSSSTLQTWACQWQSVSMTSPNFNVICKETKVALYVTVILIPLEVVVLGLVGMKGVVARKIGTVGGFERKG